MATSHARLTLHHDGPSPVHGLAADVKILATLAFVLCVVALPRRAVWAFGADLVVVLVVARWAALPGGLLLRRARVELPFVAFALLLPVVGGPPKVDVAGVALSSPGLWAAWNIVAKGTLGVLAAIVLAATTPIPQLLAGLERLRVPRLITAIAGFMVRYAEVLADDLRRMRVARLSRAHDPRWLWQARAIAATAGTLFVRAYERGERVHLAMAARGYIGTMPPTRGSPATGTTRWAAVAPCAAALAVLAVAWAVT